MFLEYDNLILIQLVIPDIYGEEHSSFTRPGSGNNLDDDVNYLSDTNSYINAKYFDSKVNQVLPEKLEEYKNRDVTKGAMFYYASYVSPYWSKDTATTKWVHTTTIETHIFGNVEKKPKNKKT
jgi:hypothetical protein